MQAVDRRHRGRAPGGDDDRLAGLEHIDGPVAGGDLDGLLAGHTAPAPDHVDADAACHLT